MAKFITAKEAAQLIPDGATAGLAGMGLSGWAEEDTIRKFVETVGQITFSGKYAPDHQEVLYVTERAVFKLIDHKLTLVEIAPGVDLEKDVLAAMDFRPEISPDLKVMDPGIFCETWGGLGNYLK